MKHLEIEWNDARTDADWNHDDAIPAHCTEPLISVGYLLKEDENEVVLVGTKSRVNPLHCMRTAIPKGWITSRTEKD